MSVDRRTGYWDREKETMTAAARRRYQDGWVRALVRHAWEKAPGVRRRVAASVATAAAANAGRRARARSARRRSSSSANTVPS